MPQVAHEGQTQNGGKTQRDTEHEESGPSRPAKRLRVAVACTRCKTRKQKCDGAHPACGNCQTYSKTCEYIVPSKTMPYGKYQYVKALESRVAELETLLSAAGLTDSGRDHWETVLRRDSFHEVNAPAEIEEQLGTTTSTSNYVFNTQHRSNKEANSPVQYLKDLSLEAGGGYVGEGSSIVGQMLSTMVRGQREPIPTPNDGKIAQLSPKSISLNENIDTEVIDELSRIPDEIAQTLLRAYFKHVSTRWIALYKPQIRQLHDNRTRLEDLFEISTLNLIYAISGRFLETTGETGNFYPERHYIAALAHLEKILQNHDLRSVQTLLLHAVYCLRAPRGLSAWTHVGLAIRIAIELGLHRKTHTERPILALEIQKRIFWSCYCLDRQLSIILGRPFAISDRDIDVQLPLDVNDSANEDDLQNATRVMSTDMQMGDSLSCFIHITRLRQIESNIQQSVYRVDRTCHLPHQLIDRFLAELAVWKDNIPAESPLEDDASDVSTYDGRVYYMVFYYKTLRLLLYPHLIAPGANTQIIVKCATACGGVLRTYKQLHRQTSVGFSLMALYSVFLSGLTLLYCMWLSPKEVYNITTSNDLNSCSIVLYVITERWPGARKYRDAFESIRQCVLDLIATSDLPRTPLTVDAGMRATLSDVQKLHPEGRAEFTRMMTDMVGEEQSHSGMTPQPFQSQFGGPQQDQLGVSNYGQDGVTPFYESTGVGGIGHSMDMLDGFDMERFLSNSQSYGNPIL